MSRLARILEMLRARRRFASNHGLHKRAKAANQAIHILHTQDDHTPPTKLVFPGVRAARAQSQAGGFPGSTDHSNPGAGWCLKMVRLCYGIPSDGTPDAITAWRRAKKRHNPATLASIPRGYPIFWAGGSEGHGHVAIATGDGRCWSTDIVRDGFFDLVPIERIREVWGLDFLGWAEDVDGQPVPAKAHE